MENLQPKIGDRVRVRQRVWVVLDVEAYKNCHVLTLTGEADRGSKPRSWRAILPFDDAEAVAERRALRRVGIRVWRRACRALLAAHGDAGTTRAAATARIDLLPYQLEPALALVNGHGVRMLIADDVGLGKTVQALMCAAELRARGVVDRVLVVCPAGLREQWADEAAARFALPLTLLDQAGTGRLRSQLPSDISPWAAEPCVVSSIDFVKRPEVLPSVLAASWDMVIVDEAHGVCGQSERRDAVAELTSRAPYALLLSATPHSGDETAFAALCGLGRLDEELVVFRRSRLEAGRDAGRRVHTVRVTMSDPERRMHVALAALTRAIRRDSAEIARHAWLTLSLLHKRALSSPFALAASAERRLHLLADQPEVGAAQLLLPLDDESGDLDGADAAPMWSVPALRDIGRERRLLEHVIDAARQAAGHEGKLLRLRRLLRALREPVIVFTEYRDTLFHLWTQVAPQAVVLHGGMTREQRRAALDAFPKAGVLLATDAAGEGLNLQLHCRCVINLELPWNPMRLEQRIGRVDRIGQRRRVHVFQLVSAHTGEAALLERLSARISQANTRIGAPNPLCGRPEWTEEASAELVVLRRERVSTPSLMAAPAVPLTRLRAEGEREAARVAAARALSAGLPADGPARLSSSLVSRTRRRGPRAALGGRVLAVFRSRVTEAGGRAIATFVNGALCPASDARHLAKVAQFCASRSPALDRWRLDSLQAHARMTTQRISRARAIATLCRDTCQERQPGLFERRSERLALDAAEDRRAARAVAEERVARAEAALSVQVSEPELVLILAPDRELSRR